MISLLYVIANFFASLFLLIAILGSIQANKTKIDIQLVLSVLIGFCSIFLAVGFGMIYPLWSLIWGFLVAGGLIMMFKPEKQPFSYNLMLGMVSWLFWSQMLVFLIFTMFVEREDVRTED
jgi:hypothetical protein